MSEKRNVPIVEVKFEVNQWQISSGFPPLKGSIWMDIWKIETKLKLSVNISSYLNTVLSHPISRCLN